MIANNDNNIKIVNKTKRDSARDSFVTTGGGKRKQQKKHSTGKTIRSVSVVGKPNQ